MAPTSRCDRCPRRAPWISARAEEAPLIVLLAWNDGQEAEQARLCRALRTIARRGWCYIVALSGLPSPAASTVMADAVNDVVLRPFGAEVLVRLRRAQRDLQAPRAAPVTPREALQEALESVSGGEVAVRSGDVVGTIHVQNGFLVWANLSSLPATIEDVVRHAGISIEPDVIAAIREESRATRAHFMDVLVNWSLIEPDHAKEALRAFVAERVKLVLDLPGASALFLPKTRRHNETMRFSAEEIPSASQRRMPRQVTPFPTLEGPVRALPLGQVSSSSSARGRSRAPSAWPSWIARRAPPSSAPAPRSTPTSPGLSSAPSRRSGPRRRT